MDIDLDLYRHEVRVSTNPLVRLSAIDISPDHPQRTFVFIHGLGNDQKEDSLACEFLLIVFARLKCYTLSEKYA